MEELRQRRKDHLRSVLMAQNFLEGTYLIIEGLCVEWARVAHIIHSTPTTHNQTNSTKR